MQLFDILSCTNKFNTIDDLYVHLDLIIDLAKDDVERIAKARKIYFFDFDSVFFLASKVLKKQLLKTHLRGIKRFFGCTNTEQAIHWIISRLLNNCQNLSQNRAYSDYVDIETFKNEVYENQSYFMIDFQHEDLFNLPIEAIKGGLKKTYNDVFIDENFDLEDFEDLCNKFSLNVIDIIGYDPQERPKMKAELTKSGHSQLILFFEDQTDLRKPKNG